VGPMTFFAHRGLAFFVLSSSNRESDITAVAEEFFGRNAGIAITCLYFLAIYPILLVYGVSLTNTVESFLIHQLGLSSPPRILLSGICVGTFITIILVGEKAVLAFNEKLTYPLCTILLGLSFYLMPHWHLSSFQAIPTAKSLLETLWVTLPVLVFAFNHSPAISTFAVSQRAEYGDEAERKASTTLCATSGILVLFVMFFVFSCVLSLSPEKLAEANQQNISILSYLANHFNNPLLAYLGPLIAFLAISTSFFGHYLGAREGLNGLIVKANRNAPLHSTKRERGIALFFFVTIWIAAINNPSVLDIIEDLAGPVIVMILFIMPMIAIAKVPAMKKYKGRLSNIFVTLLGLVTITSLIASLLGF
ncbi:MAG: serine transporter, partial [Desulfovibrio sp.]|nr:serine transporter [Desulfovibrio sp.]